MFPSSMCGRYTDTKRDKQFLVRMGVEQAEIDFVPRYNLAPTQSASIIACADDDRPELRRSRWGLIPFWARDEKIGNSLINARAETIASKPAFRTSFRKKRCLILADGFFEWQNISGGKQPVYIHMKDGVSFVFGGLWDRWNDLETFSIITVEPNALLSTIHTRMPLILPQDAVQRWLDPATPVGQLIPLLRPYAADPMEFFPVSTLVNTPRVDSPELIQRANAVPLKPVRAARAKIEEPLLPGF
ncbi:MAG: SOS response-associated peptidase [Limisphaerales bacterium]